MVPLLFPSLGQGSRASQVLSAGLEAKQVQPL